MTLAVIDRGSRRATRTYHCAAPALCDECIAALRMVAVPPSISRAGVCSVAIERTTSRQHPYGLDARVLTVSVLRGGQTLAARDYVTARDWAGPARERCVGECVGRIVVELRRQGACDG